MQEDSRHRDASLEHHELKLLYKKALDQLNTQEKILDCCRRSIQSLPLVSKITTKVSESSREASNLIAVAPLSDTHGGEVVRLAETGGLAAYDMTIFNRRLALWVNRILLLTEIRRSADRVSTLYVPELGDMISGDIHDELARTNTDAAMQVTVSVAYCISQALAKLAAHFDSVEVSGVVGNHGRMTKEKTFKKGAVMNWDYLCYQLQTLFLAKQQNIRFTIPESFWHVIEIGNWRILTFHGGSIQCVDTETECLTYDGWKKYSELQIGELILTYNEKTSTAEYQPLQNITVSPYNGPMIHWKTRALDMLVTPNHRCVIDHRDWVNRRKEDAHASYTRCIKRADKLNTQDAIVSCAMSFKNCNSIEDWSDKEVELLGWLLSEGCPTYKGVRKRFLITQSGVAHPKYVAEIEQCLLDLNIPYTKRVGIRQKHMSKAALNARCPTITNNGGFANFYFSYSKFEVLDTLKPFPKWVLRFPRKQLEILMFTLLKGDGTGLGKPRQTPCFYQTNEQSLQIFEQIAVQCGYRTHRTHPHSILVSLHDRERSFFKTRQRHTVNYQGLIWCPQTANGTWFARRNGKTFITGNSYNSIPFYGIDRAVAKFREMLYSGHQYFDDVLLGHFHTDAQIGRARGSVYISGSMRGGDEYAMARLQAYSPPTQMLLFYHPDHGCVSKETLFLQPADTREDLGFKMTTLDSWQHLVVK